MDARERVARAMYPADWEMIDAKGAQWCRDIGFPQEYSLAKADAAIAAHLEALREPTEEMVEAGAQVILRSENGHHTTAHVAFAAMIDAAHRPEWRAPPCALDEPMLPGEAS